MVIYILYGDNVKNLCAILHKGYLLYIYATHVQLYASVRTEYNN